ncbi:MAG: O-antigen ligase family protein [Bacteroidota bacterium]
MSLVKKIVPIPNKQLVLFIALLLVSIIFSMAISFIGWKVGVGIILFIVAVPIAVKLLGNLKFGVVLILVFSFFLQGVNKFLPLPLGVLLDALVGLMFLSLIVNKWRSLDFSVANDAISWVIILWISYNLLEVFNPYASIKAWVFVIRSLAGLMLFYFVVLRVVDTIRFFEILIHLWVGLALLGALYGLFQEFNGLLPFEKKWVTAKELRFKLIFNWGRFRIFSFFSDPTVFGVLMAYTGLFCMTMLASPLKLFEKLYFGIAGILMLLAMIYAGTRTAYAMIAAGFVFYAILTFKPGTIALTGIFGLIMGLIVFTDISSLGPLGNNSLNRIRSAFSPGDDPSYQIREKSQEFIQPYIQTHPIGGGLGSVGIWGQKFSPGSFLSDFAPDSGYVRVAVELGWIGLLIYLAFFFVSLRRGIKNYFRIRNPRLKSYVGGLTTVVMSLTVGNWPQQAVIQLPTMLLFYTFLAMLVKSKELDRTLTIK